MRGHRHHKQLAALALTAAVTLVGCGGEDGSSSDGEKDKDAKAKPSKSAGASQGGGGAIPSEGVVVKAWCAVPANNQADVIVEAWDDKSWKKVATTKFTLPPTTVLREEDDARTPLAELCKDGVVEPGDTGEDEGPPPFAEPRVRQVFNDDFTKLAVVLQDPKTEGTRAAIVTPGGNKPQMVNKAGGSDFADAPTEQHPIFAPGGKDEVWYLTQGENDKEPSIFSSPAKPRGKGDSLSIQRPGFTLAGNPTSAITASALRISPDGRKAAGFHELQGMNVVDVPRRSSVQRDEDATLRELPNCYPWGWTDNTTVLCGPRMTEDDPARENNFWTMETSGLAEDVADAPKGAVGKPILPKTSRENTLSALSADGTQMLITSQQGSVTEHFTSPTKPGSTPKKITAPGAERAFRVGTVVEWR